MPTLYMFYASPPVRAVLITAKAIGLELTIKELDFIKGEHLEPEFTKLNPQHTVPTLVDDDGFTIWDSHAIIVYLVSKYAKNDALYPSDIRKRAIINQRLHFESGVVFTQLRGTVRPVFREGKTELTQQDRDGVQSVYDTLEQILGGRKWVAGDFVSVADYSLISSISSLNAIVPISAKTSPRVAAWVKNVEGLPEYEANKKGLSLFAEFVKSKVTNL